MRTTRHAVRHSVWGSSVLAAAVLATASCGADGSPESSGQGALAFQLWGEEFIEQGIPSSVFADGWSVRFTRFLIVLRNVKVSATATEPPIAAMDTPRVFDLTRPGRQEVASFAALPARAYPYVSFQIGPVDPSVTLGDGVSVADRDDLVARGAVMRVVGTATKEAQTKSFDWSFGVPVVLESCGGIRGGTHVQGAVVTSGGHDVNEITIHGDHLFYDHLASELGQVRFQHLADADAQGDGDGVVTLAELAAVKLTSFSPYEFTTGAADIDDLAGFVSALSRTVAHYRGEGECVARSLR